MKKIFKLLFICLLITGCRNVKYENIDTNKALELINDGAIIIDVRTKEEYEDSHIKGALNIPLDNIETINYDKDTTLIIYCATGMRSLSAVSTLNDLGYTSLYNLDGGLINWGSEIED